MGDLATAMRDPIFYVWHKFVNDIFVRYKSTLPGYTKDEVCYGFAQFNYTVYLQEH